MTDKAPRVVAIGGGHGLAATIRAVRGYAAQTTAVVATADDGGSTGRLRSGMDIPAPGDLRRCLVAMAGAEEHPLGRAFEYRFGGTDVEGHALGNLLLAALGVVTGDFMAATDEVAQLLGLDPTQARVVPATVEPVELRATTVDGATVVGQLAVTETEHLARVQLRPPGVKVPDGVAEMVLDAHQVVLGPGSLYTSVLAAAVVDELREALAVTRAQRVYVCNLRTQIAETQGYDVARHIAALQDHGIQPDIVVVHDVAASAAGSSTDPAPPERTWPGAVARVDGDAVNLGSDLDGLGAQIVVADVARPHGMAHDSGKLSAVLAELAGSTVR